MGRWEADPSNPGILDGQRISNSEGSFWLGIFVGILFLLGGIAILNGTVLPTNRLHAALRERGIAVNAVTLPSYANFGRQPGPDEPKRVPYSFTDGMGLRRRGRALLPAALAPEVGTTLPVRYLATDPETCMTEYELKHDDGLKSALYLCAWIAFSTAFAATMIYGLLKNRRP